MGKDAWLTGGLPPIRDLEDVSLRLYNLEVRHDPFGAMWMMNHQATSPSFTCIWRAIPREVFVVRQDAAG